MIEHTTLLYNPLMTTLIFFGSDQYASTVLTSLLVSKQLENISIVTDQKNPPNPVEKLANTHTLKVAYYPSFDHSLITKDTLGLCASFDHLIPPDLIKLFGGQLYNLHPSLLPQYRNVSPVPYAIAMGDKVTGITLHLISEGIDSGEIVAQVEEPIRPDDTSPLLLHRLFTLGGELFSKHVTESNQNGFTATRIDDSATPLIFTRRLTSTHGYVEWPVLQKLLAGKPVLPDETENPLLRLRLTRLPEGNILHDLVRALSGWERVWTLAPHKKAAGPEPVEGVELRLTIESVLPKLTIKLASKPKAISWSDFEKYYLRI